MSSGIDKRFWVDKVIYFPHEMRREVDEFANRRGNSYNAAVRELVRRGLEQERQRTERQEVAV